MNGGKIKGRVLVVAGSDSGGGAGIQADLKTVMALGGYAMTAITAVTAQNTLGVDGIVGLAPEFVQRQMTAVLDDIGADAVKTGMLMNAAIVEAVAAMLARQPTALPFVLDPVMVAKGGASLLDDDAVAAMRSRLFPLATIITPNVPEAEALLGRRIRDIGDMRRGAVELSADGRTAVLLKGGHLDSARIHDVLVTRSGIAVYDGERLPTRHTHGTGCTLASAIATGLAQGMAIADAVVRARDFVRDAIMSAPGFGNGHGPLDHGCRIVSSSHSGP